MSVLPLLSTPCSQYLNKLLNAVELIGPMKNYSILEHFVKFSILSVQETGLRL